MPRQCNYFIIIIACMWVCVFGIHILDIFRITQLNKGVHLQGHCFVRTSNSSNHLNRKFVNDSRLFAIRFVLKDSGTEGNRLN